jgi:hypothetical protein
VPVHRKAQDYVAEYLEKAGLSQTSRSGREAASADSFSFDLRTVQKAQDFNMVLPFTHFINDEVFSIE